MTAPLPAGLAEQIEALIALQEYEYPADSWQSMRESVDAGAQHSGDCTGQCHTCFVCQVTEIRQKAAAILALCAEAWRRRDAEQAARIEALEAELRAAYRFIDAYVRLEQSSFDLPPEPADQYSYDASGPLSSIQCILNQSHDEICAVLQEK